jgi:hypothetical protein
MLKKLCLAGALLAGGSGCGGALGGAGCTDLYAFGLGVAVVSASTGAAICDATVTISDGAYRETLMPVQGVLPDGGLSCAFEGAGERAGTYTIDAKSGSSEKTMEGIVVTRDACHVMERSVTIDL